NADLSTPSLHDALPIYFVRTQAWDLIQRGEVDLIYGPKGAGKSALYVLTQEHAEEWRQETGILQIAAENPRGTPAFKDLDIDPRSEEHTSELQSRENLV